MSRRKVLVLCTGNSCRSQMAEGIVNHLLADRWQAFSAGTKPSRINPRTIRVMAEIGIDISHHRSKSLAEFTSRNDLDLVITVCDDAKESCPIFPGRVRRVHLSFEDPAPYSDAPDEVALPVFRRVRDQIRMQIPALLKGFENNS